MAQITRSLVNRPENRSGEILDDPVMADVAVIASVICDAEAVMLVLAPASPDPAGATLRFACGFDRPPPDPATVLELHRNAGGDALLLPRLADAAWAGFGYCGVALWDHEGEGALIGVLCVLLRPRGQRQVGEVLLPARRVAAFEAFGRQLSARPDGLRAPGGTRPRLPATAPADGLPDVPAAPRILVVDDEEVVRMLVVDLLRERGYAVRESEDADGAMACLQSGEPFDLMVTDVGLPGGFDGSTLARHARVLHPGLPILFITGYAFGTNGDVTLEPGIPVLTKPFTLAALSERIIELLAAGHR